MNSGVIILLITFILTGFTLAFTPYMTRKTENFGVTIPEALFNRQDFKKMRRKFTTILLIIGALFSSAIIISIFLFSAEVTYIVSTILIVIFVVGSFLLYLPFHFKMKKIKAAENWHESRGQAIVVDMKFREEKLTLSNWWFILPGLIILATLAVTFIFYDDIPDQIPMHTDFAGNVTYDDKSVTNLLFLPGTQIFIFILFLFINIVIKQSKQQVSVENPEKSKQQNIIFRRRWSAYMIGTAILMQIMFFFIQLSFIYPNLKTYEDIIIFSVIFIVLFGTIALAITTGQSGSRVKINTNKNHDAMDRDDDKYWKLGQFYVNRNDPAIFIEKRFGVGWTNNWAHPVSWIFIIGIIAVPIIMLVIF